jgi:glycosyltransferase involved in cell wall biosynthesis
MQHHASARKATSLPNHRLRFVAIIPALNEASCIGHVVQQLKALTRSDGSRAFYEVVVGDNGSTDTTREVAASAGALVARAQSRGYGHGCMAAIREAPTTDAYVFVDGDDTLNYAEIESLLSAIETGADLVIGRRVHRARHSMSLPQRFGNALCCLFIRQLWRADVHDLGPLRVIRADAFHALDMQAFTYGWTLEMQIKAHEQGLLTIELPVSTLARNSGASKVSSTLRAAARCGRVMLWTIFTLWRTRETRAAAHPAVHSSAFHPISPTSKRQRQFLLPTQPSQ